MTARPLRLCLVMHSTRSDNLGVGALTVSEVEILRGIGRDLGRGVEITVFDWKDPGAPYVTGPDVRVADLDMRALLDPRRFLRVVRGMDAVIDVGAGDSFADIYGGARLRRMFLIKALVHAAGVPLVMAPQTVGPFTRPLSRRLARPALDRAAIVATRDSPSTAAVRELGVRRAVIEASDLALRLPYGSPPRPSGPPRVGINVSGLLMGGGYTGRNEFGPGLDYPSLVHGLVQGFREMGAEVHLVQHVILRSGRRAEEDDGRASAAVAARFPGTVLAPSFASPSEAKTYIAGMDFFMGARMHACIAALSAGVPVVPMAYSRKFAGLFGTLGYAHTVDCRTESAAAILAKARAAYANREVLAHEARLATREGLARLARYEAALADLLGTIS